MRFISADCRWLHDVAFSSILLFHSFNLWMNETFLCWVSIVFDLTVLCVLSCWVQVRLRAPSHWILIFSEIHDWGQVLCIYLSSFLPSERVQTLTKPLSSFYQQQDPHKRLTDDSKVRFFFISIWRDLFLNITDRQAVSIWWCCVCCFRLVIVRGDGKIWRTGRENEKQVCTTGDCVTFGVNQALYWSGFCSGLSTVTF